MITRSQIRPLHQPADIYVALARLVVGDPVPLEVYIADYRDDAIPPWVVREIEISDSLLILTVCDESEWHAPTLWAPSYCVARDVFTQPTKTHAGPLYGYYPGCVHGRNMLADIRQHARQIANRAGVA
jgi:hypothetical protein